MAHPEFFRKLGLYVLSDVFDVESCAQLRSEIRAAASGQARIVGTTGAMEGTLDESMRRVSCAMVPESTRLLVKSELQRLKPKMEEHFQVTVTGCHGPDFLIYETGAFYKPHRDANAGSRPDILQRQISIVIFLNAPTQAPPCDGYGGGSLTFYGLLSGSKWDQCAFSLEASPGLLIAFRPSVLHEVTPITSGQRFTIAAWFTSDLPSNPT